MRQTHLCPVCKFRQTPDAICESCHTELVARLIVLTVEIRTNEYLEAIR